MQCVINAMMALGIRFYGAVNVGKACNLDYWGCCTLLSMVIQAQF